MKKNVKKNSESAKPAPQSADGAETPSNAASPVGSANQALRARQRVEASRKAALRRVVSQASK